MPLQTLQTPAFGGLDLVSAPQTLAQKAGAAIRLNNFEALAEGGYRRINGFHRLGDIPDVIDEEDIRGIAYYKGLVVVVGHYVLHSPDTGTTWNVVNKDNVDKVTPDTLNGLDLLPREGKGPVEFSVINSGTTDVLVITDDVSHPAELTFEARKYTYKVAANDGVKGYRFCARYQDHVVYAGSIEKPGSIAVSDRFNPLGFTKAGSWEAQVGDEIVGLHTFRDYLYIFCRGSIYRVINLESKDNVAIRPVTTKVGCIDGRSIQEIGGDVLFLADDGLRYLGATERIDDVSINLVSGLIRPIINNASPKLGPISSVVIPSKAQYRLYFTDSRGRRTGIIGTLQVDGQFSWSTTDHMLVEALTMTTEGEKEKVYHIGSPTIGTKSVYRYDYGDSFDGKAIIGSWQVPDFHMGDSAVRKTLHFIDVYLEPEGSTKIKLEVTYDHESLAVVQPEPFYIEPQMVAARWGESVWEDFEWGSVRYTLADLFLEGSGNWIQLTFRDDGTNPPYIIRGFDLQFTPAGRI